MTEDINKMFLCGNCYSEVGENQRFCTECDAVFEKIPFLKKTIKIPVTTVNLVVDGLVVRFPIYNGEIHRQDDLLSFTTVSKRCIMMIEQYRMTGQIVHHEDVAFHVYKTIYEAASAYYFTPSRVTAILVKCE